MKRIGPVVAEFILRLICQNIYSSFFSLPLISLLTLLSLHFLPFSTIYIPFPLYTPTFSTCLYLSLLHFSIFLANLVNLTLVLLTLFNTLYLFIYILFIIPLQPPLACSSLHHFLSIFIILALIPLFDTLHIFILTFSTLYHYCLYLLVVLSPFLKHLLSLPSLSSTLHILIYPFHFITYTNPTCLFFSLLFLNYHCPCHAPNFSYFLPCSNTSTKFPCFHYLLLL